jgi:hypothetical protein
MKIGPGRARRLQPKTARLKDHGDQQDRLASGSSREDPAAVGSQDVPHGTDEEQEADPRVGLSEIALDRTNQRGHEKPRRPEQREARITGRGRSSDAGLATGHVSMLSQAQMASLK